MPSIELSIVIVSYFSKLYSTLNKGNNAGWQKRGHESKKLLRRMELPTLLILQKIALIWLLWYPLPCLTISSSYIVVCALVKGILKMLSWVIRISSKLLESCNMHTVLNSHETPVFSTAKFTQQMSVLDCQHLPEGRKYTAAVDWKLKLVSQTWFWESIKEKGGFFN